MGKQNRLLAFWDKTDDKETFVLATHGFIKKSKKTPSREIDKAKALRQLYFSSKATK